MKTMNTLLMAALVAAVATTQAVAKPLKVYILAGQSNMQGKAKRRTVPRMAVSPESKALHDKMVDEKGNLRVYEDVQVAYETASGGVRKYNGPLPLNDRGFGPEYTFGITMYEHLKEPILLIKAAWGGKSLRHHFRSPSAGLMPISEDTVKDWKEKGIYESKMAAYTEENGHYYRLMIDLVKEVLADPGKYHPAYDPEQGYEIAGFVWFQGWNDMIATGFYPEEKGDARYEEYSRLLSLFIEDVRKDVNAPEMPFVIGVLGVKGETDGPFQKAMAAPAQIPAFKGNVAAVLTGKFWDFEMEKILRKNKEEVKKISQIDNVAHAISKEGKKLPAIGWTSVGTPAPEERVWRYISVSTEPGKKYPDLCEGFFFDVATSDKLKDWYKPGFDDSSWNKGKAPIGNGPAFGGRPRRAKEDRPTVQPVSAWGDGDYLLMRTTFELKDLDFNEYRLSVLARLGYVIYLNGQKIDRYYWYSENPVYNHRRKGLVDETLAPHKIPLKKGTNVLAIYANAVGAGNSRPKVVIDADIEGLTTDGAEELNVYMDRFLPRRQRIISRGLSNGHFHYNGSAYTYGLIGEAFGKAMIEMEKNQ